MGSSSVLFGCNKQCGRNLHNFGPYYSYYYRTSNDLKCCSACALPHLYVISHQTKFLYGYAMAQVSRCWPLSVETGFNARPAHMGSPLVKEALEQIFLRSILACHQCSIQQQYTLSNWWCCHMKQSSTRLFTCSFQHALNQGKVSLQTFL